MSSVPGAHLRFAAALAAAAAALAGVVLAGGVMLTNDGPQHVYGSYARAHLDDPAFGAFVHAASPISVGGFAEVFRLFETFLGWQGAYCGAVVVVALAWAFGFVALVLARAAGPRRWLALLGFPLALQLTFWIGVLPFVAGAALGMLALALWPAAGAPLTPVRAASLAVVFYGCAYCHTFPFLFLFGLLAFVALVERRWLALAFLPVLSAPALACVWLSAGERIALAPVAATATLSWPQFGGVDVLLDELLSGPPWRGWCALALAVAGVLCALTTPRTDRARVRNVALAVACFGGMLIAALSPRDVFGWELARSRVFACALPVLVSLIALERLATQQRLAVRLAAAGALVAFGAASLGWSLAFHLERRAAFAPLVEDIARLPRSPRLWAVIVADTSGGLGPSPIAHEGPLLHAAQLAAVQLGGLAAWTQATSPRLHQIVALNDVPSPGPVEWATVRALSGERRTSYLRRLAAIASRTGAVILFPAKPGDVDVVAGVGFRSVFTSERLFVGTFAGCAAAVDVSGVDGSVEVQAGLWPLTEPDTGFVVDGAEPQALELTPFACGEVWVRPLRGRCAGAGPDGYLRATLAPDVDEQRIACTWQP